MTEQPNILIIMSDQHNPRFLGCAGDPLVQTPNLDALAAGGVRFSDCSCANPLSVPSRMAFLTSRHSHDIMVYQNGEELRSDRATFPMHLAAAGYDTVLCGRMHFCGADQRHGFARRIIGDVDPRFDHIPKVTAGQSAAGIQTAGPGRTAYQAYDRAVTERACSFLREQPADRQPWLLTVGYVLPHCPFICPKALFETYYPDVAPPPLPLDRLDALHPAIRGWLENRGCLELTDDERRTALAAYYGLCTLTDQLVGQVLNQLAASPFADDTLVVYTSDHGEMAGEQGLWWKSSFYQGSVGVPLIVRPPGGGAGRVVDAVTSLLDVGPTCLDYADAPRPTFVRGRSLRSWCETGEPPEDWSDEVYAEFGGDPRYGTPAGRMVRRGPWKLNHYHGHETPQLFCLADDPAEVQDRAADPACAAVRAELEQLLTADGWSGERVAAHVAQWIADREVVTASRQATHHEPDAPPDRWTAPDGCTIFPEGYG